MIDKAVLAKIRKCLALSASANEHEAAAAMAKARALMDEHGVDDDALAMADIEERAARGSRRERPSHWENMLCATVRRAMQVDVFIDENRDRRYIGRGARPEIASYAFVVLHRQLKRARAAYIAGKLRRCKPGRKRARADAFCEGWAATVLRKIVALYPKFEDAGVRSYIVARHPGLVTVKARSGAADDAVAQRDWLNGAIDGRSVNLHQGMGGADSVKALASA